jgi:CRISPR-associated exonuclease Cas4
MTSSAAPPPEIQSRPEQDLVPISALNHYLFCDRRCALIHTEGIFPVNHFVAEGNRIHERVDEPGLVTRRGCRSVRALSLYSERLGLSGRADLVEFWPAGNHEEPRPVDYKRGPRKSWDNDQVQLCAQGLCLEEMFKTPVFEGSIYHAQSRRRTVVQFTPALRALTERTVERVRQLLASGEIPRAVYRPRCHGCSLEPVCLPQETGLSDRYTRYLREVFRPGKERL